MQRRLLPCLILWRHNRLTVVMFSKCIPSLFRLRATRQYVQCTYICRGDGDNRASPLIKFHHMACQFFLFSGVHAPHKRRKDFICADRRQSHWGSDSERERERNHRVALITIVKMAIDEGRDTLMGVSYNIDDGEFLSLCLPQFFSATPVAAVVVSRRHIICQN